jgi:hypothetical protein
LNTRECKHFTLEALAICLWRRRFGTNAGVNHLKLMAQAARVPLNRVFYDDVPKNGHLHSCWSDQSEELFHAV